MRIFLAEFHGREIQKPFILTINYIARATVLLNIEENDKKKKEDIFSIFEYFPLICTK